MCIEAPIPETSRYSRMIGQGFAVQGSTANLDAGEDLKDAIPQPAVESLILQRVKGIFLWYFLLLPGTKEST